MIKDDFPDIILADMQFRMLRFYSILGFKCICTAIMKSWSSQGNSWVCFAISSDVLNGSLAGFDCEECSCVGYETIERRSDSKYRCIAIPTKLLRTMVDHGDIIRKSKRSKEYAKLVSVIYGKGIYGLGCWRKDIRNAIEKRKLLV